MTRNVARPDPRDRSRSRRGLLDQPLNAFDAESSDFEERHLVEQKNQTLEIANSF